MCTWPLWHKPSFQTAGCAVHTSHSFVRTAIFILNSSVNFVGTEVNPHKIPSKQISSVFANKRLICHFYSVTTY